MREIAKARELTESTIWTHLEQLIKDDDLVIDDIKHLEPNDMDWLAVRAELDAAMAEHGIERLKPLFEATGEKYDYNLIRLARMQYVLEGKAGEAVF